MKHRECFIFLSHAWALLHPIPLHRKLSFGVVLFCFLGVFCFVLFSLLHNMKTSEHILLRISISESPKWCEKSWKISNPKSTMLGKIRRSGNSSEECTLESVSTRSTFPEETFSPGRLGCWEQNKWLTSAPWPWPGAAYCSYSCH